MNAATQRIPTDSRIPFRLHPRVFAALGADLVTNDVVAVIELVKNSYDAVADNVWIRFGKDAAGESYLEIEDDGQGMTRDVLENVWCVVATPYKELNPVVRRGDKERRVVGEKGLGRLSAARLGHQLEMMTRAARRPCLRVEVDWNAIARADTVENSYAECTEFKGAFRATGTLLRIRELNGVWDDGRLSDLRENLARLISPFSDTADFTIHLSGFDRAEDDDVAIEAPRFLSHPKYAVKGKVDRGGNVEGNYRFRPVKNGKPRDCKVELSWERIYDGISDRTGFSYRRESAGCGPFSFDIRAWDIGSDDTQEISDRYGLQKNLIRRAIRAHKGVSVYRDGVLVLPKSDSARDWLGLDLRRVSKTGVRLSTSQVVGYVAISADANKGIEDTSDRERLVSRIEVAEFEEILKAVVGQLETERDADRRPDTGGETAENLFDEISPRDLATKAADLAEQGADAGEVVSLVRDYVRAFDTGRAKISQRLVYYSRLATVGTIAEMLIHEIRNRTTVFGSFIQFIRDRFGPLEDDLAKKYQQAERAVDALEQLADTYAPLANRSFRRGARKAIVEQCIANCVSMLEGEIQQKRVQCSVPASTTCVAVDPGELEAVILNLTTNALYWMGQAPRESRILRFTVDSDALPRRVKVAVADSGPGIKAEDMEKVFLPGVTRKPGGFGMGLTVAAEVVAGHGGRIGLVAPYRGGGAKFEFDLPAA